MDETADCLDSLHSLVVILLFFSTEPWKCAEFTEDRLTLCDTALSQQAACELAITLHGSQQLPLSL